MKPNSNSKRLTRAVLIGIVGVLVLSVSAFAAWGSSTGYGKYKDAVTKVFTETENVTIDGKISVLYDGDVASKNEMQWKIDGTDYSRMEKELPTKYNEEYGTEFYYWALGNTEGNFYSGEDNYYQYERDMNYAENPLSLGEYGDKAVKFAKLCADTVLGDLKNNVVLVDDKNGIRSYTLDVTADQIPALINAGLDLLMSVEDVGSGYVIYDDTDAVHAFYCESVMGEPLPEGYFDELYADDAPGEMWDEYNTVREKMDAYYEEIRQKGGETAMLYVYSDGSYDLYEDYSEYAFDQEYGTTDISAYLGSNAVLHKVRFDFALDENDRLVSNDLSILMNATDSKGKSHTVEMKIEVDFSDYGVTEVTAFDPGDRTLVQ